MRLDARKMIVLGMLGRSLQSRAIAALTAAAGSEPWYLFDHRGSQYQWQSIAGTTPAAAGQPVGKVDPVAGTLSVAAAADNSTRPTLLASPAGISFDAMDDALAGASGGGGSTGFFLCGAIRHTATGSVQIIWNDRFANYFGYSVQISAANLLTLVAGAGTPPVVLLGGAIPAGVNSVITAWDDGTNLNVQVNLGTVASTARPAVAAGTSTFTVGKSNIAAANFFAGSLVCDTYIRNVSPDAATRLLTQRLMAQWAGVSL